MVISKLLLKACAGHGDARNHSHFRQEIVAFDVVFVGLAYALASKVDGRVSRSLSSLAASVTDKCARIRNEDVDEPVNASRAVSPVHRPPDGVAWLTQNAARTTLRDSFWPQTATHGGHGASTMPPMPGYCN